MSGETNLYSDRRLKHTVGYFLLGRAVQAVAYFALPLWLVALFSSALEGADALQMIMAAENYFFLFGVLVAISLKRQSLLKLRWVFLVATSTAVTVFLAEVKAVFLYLPAAIFMLYWRQILRRPGEFIMVATVVAALVAAMPLIYDKLHYSAAGRTSQHTLMERIEYQSNTDAIDPHKRNLPRGEQLGFWWSENVSRGDYQHVLFGYGMGATHAGSLGEGKLVKRYFCSLESTSSGILLWETGILGLLLMISPLLSASSRARHMAAGNETRLSLNKPIRLDERWRTDMSAEKNAYFEQHAGVVNRRLGYVD